MPGYLYRGSCYDSSVLKTGCFRNGGLGVLTLALVATGAIGAGPQGPQQESTTGQVALPSGEIVDPKVPSVQWSASDPRDKATTPKEKELLAELRSWFGVPYRYGGNTREGVDTSGLVKTAYAKIGIKLPRHSQQMKDFGEPVMGGNLHFGDLLVMNQPNRHVAVYVGNGRIIEATPPAVRESTMRGYRRAWVRRMFP